MGEAFKTVTDIAGSRATASETSVLLLASLDAERSYAITSAREGRPWTGIYPAYQKTLHAVLLHQADHGTYTAVVDCENRSLDDLAFDDLRHDRPAPGTSTEKLFAARARVGAEYGVITPIGMAANSNDCLGVSLNTS